MRRRIGLGGAALFLAVVGAVPAGAQEASGGGSPPAVEEGPVRVHLVPETRVLARGPAPEPGPDNVEGPWPTVGDRFWVTVRTSGPSGYGLLPGSLIRALDERPEVAVTGSERRDGLLRLELASFRPGDAPLPEVRAAVVSAAGDTVRVPVTSDTVRVASVLAPADTVLADIKPLWVDRGWPAWLRWAAAAAALAALLLAWWWQRRRREEPAAVVRRRRDAYTVARERIEELKDEPDSVEGRIRAAAGIGDALRVYLSEGWGVAAPEMTTLELLGSLPERAASGRPALGSVLRRADLAKFARVAPERGDVPSLGGRALEVLDALESSRSGAGPTETGVDAASVEREAAS